jgi:DNA-binding transcriptional ArsR family regulator
VLRIVPRAINAAARDATGRDAAGRDADSADDARLDQVFAALSDPIRRRILQRLDEQALLVSELATPFDISLQGVSRHIQVLVRAGLVQQERSGRISRCSLDAGPLLDAAVWLNRYTKYWQEQFDVLAATLTEIDERRGAERARSKKRGRPSRHR